MLFFLPPTTTTKTRFTATGLHNFILNYSFTEVPTKRSNIVVKHIQRFWYDNARHSAKQVIYQANCELVIL